MAIQIWGSVSIKRHVVHSKEEYQCPTPGQVGTISANGDSDLGQRFY
jgi:hypothetical protein